MPKPKVAPGVLLKLIEQYGPVSVHDVIDLTPFAQVTLNRVARELKASGQLHIVDWVNNNQRGGKPAPVYAFGPGRSKPRPKATKEREAIQKRESAARRKATNPTLAKVKNIPALAGNPFGSLIAQL